MKFSIIIPVYNVEKYVEKCLLSIVNQNYEDYEIVIVDDGSKDKSGEICDAFAQKYSHVKVFHIANNGVSNARNVALKHATGDYVWFVDSDDYLEPDALLKIESWLQKYKNADLLIFDASVVNEEGQQVGEITSNLPCGQSMQFFTHREFIYANTSLWNRIYRMDLIREKRLSFEENISIAEDLLFNYKYLLGCQHIYYEKTSLYYYIQRKNSAMSGAGKNKDVQTVFERLLEYYREQGQYDMFQTELEYLTIYHYFIVTSVRMIRCGSDAKECRSVADWFKENRVRLSLGNPYVKRMAKKHILLFVLLKMRCYKVIAMLFKRF